MVSGLTIELTGGVTAYQKQMAKVFCDFRFLLLVAAVIFIYIQMRLFAAQSEYADRLAAAIEAENHCTSQSRSLIDQISLQQGRIVVLEEERKRRDQECGQMKSLVQDLERKDLQRLIDKMQVPVAAVVIMACNRADYLERTINSVLKYQRLISSRYPLFVSQDGSNPDVKHKALSYDQLSYMQHLDFEPVQTERPGELIAYYKIARHYKWALDQLFYKHNFSRVIILEDDMEIAPDFFDYFEAAATLLDKDKSIMAVSSWNDNGQKQFVHDPYELYRSDFFPGLGWMLARSTWDELSPKWPKAYPYLPPCLSAATVQPVTPTFQCSPKASQRTSAQPSCMGTEAAEHGRQFIRPEVCRTYNFGEHGSSFGQFYKQYLEPIKLNDVKVDWKSMDLSYLLEDKYSMHFANIVKKATPVYGADMVLKAYNIDGDVRIKYIDQSHFENIARQFGIFEEWKDGVPRAAYKGVVVFRYQTSRRIFLVGPESLKLLQIEES
ncbi:Alpha-1,3-mannosyl-glycoprotein 2-beta-N-acetylglucosaminyltransferase, partial [Mucuna pruriens]